MNIEQTVDGLYTPNYELYDFKIIGLPFNVNKITVDENDVVDYQIDENNCLRFKSNKNFTSIKIYN
ncbi:hypothetical protein D3C87_1721750 [compost metagenome]